MTKREIRKLRRGTEVFNSITGELGRITCFIPTEGNNALFVESIDNEGRFNIWIHSKINKA